MVVLGQSGSSRAEVAVFGQNCLASESGFIWAKWLCLGKVVAFRSKWLFSGKVVVNWQSGCNRPKVVVFG